MVVSAKRQHKKGARASKTAKADLQWWFLFMDHWNGKALILDGNKILAKQLSSDASNKAVGAVYKNQLSGSGDPVSRGSI